MTDSGKKKPNGGEHQKPHALTDDIENSLEKVETLKRELEKAVTHHTEELERTRKELLQMVDDARKYAENIVNTVRHPLLVLDSEMHVLSTNNAFYKY